MTVWKNNGNRLYEYSYKEEEEEEERSPYAFISSSEIHHFMKRSVGKSDTIDKSRGLGRCHITGTLIINSIGYTKGHICWNSKSRIQEI